MLLPMRHTDRVTFNPAQLIASSTRASSLSDKPDKR